MRSAITLVSMLVLGACNAVEAQKGETAETTGSGTERSVHVGGLH